MGTAVLIVFAAVVTTAFSALAWLRSRWDLDSGWEVLYEIGARLLPGRPRTVKSLRRALTRRACAAHEALPSGTVQVPEVIELTVAEEDFLALEGRYDLTAFLADLEQVIRTQASKHGYRLPASGPVVSLTSSPVIHPGWVPAARGASVRQHLAHAQVEGTPLYVPDWMSAGASPAAGTPAVVPPARPVRVSDEVKTVVLDGDVTVPAGEASTTVMAPVFVLTGADGTSYDLHPPRMVIGRSEACGIRLRDQLVSRRHAELVFTGGTWHVHNLASTNGVFVDGVTLKASCVLTVGNTIQLGRTGPVLTFRRRD